MRYHTLPLLAALALSLAGCFQVNPPPFWSCSASEPACPAGLRCNGQRCVETLTSDGWHRDLGRDTSPTDYARPDLGIADLWVTLDQPAKPDAPHVPCSTLEDWVCYWDQQGGHWVDLVCDNRVLTCTHDQIGWYCDCEIGKTVKPCWDIAQPFDLCDTAATSFEQGCCHP